MPVDNSTYHKGVKFLCTAAKVGSAGHTYLNKQGLVLVSLISLDAYDPLCLGLEGKVSPEGLLQPASFASQLVCILLCQLPYPKCPAIMRAGKGDIAQLRLKVVFFVFQVDHILPACKTRLKPWQQLCYLGLRVVFCFLQIKSRIITV